MGQFSVEKLVLPGQLSVEINTVHAGGGGGGGITAGPLRAGRSAASAEPTVKASAASGRAAFFIFIPFTVSKLKKPSDIRCPTLQRQ
jgi:hypothetical protein